MAVVLAIEDAGDADALVAWAVRFAETHHAPLEILCGREEGKRHGVRKLPPGAEPPDEQGLAVHQALDRLGRPHVEVFSLIGRPLARALGEALLDREPTAVILGVRGDGASVPGNGVAAQLVRELRCDVHLVSVGGTWPKATHGVLVPLIGGCGLRAILEGARLVPAAPPIRVLLDPAHEARSQRVLERAREELPGRGEGRLQVETAGGDWGATLAEAAAAEDLVVVENERASELSRVRDAVKPLLARAPESRPTLHVVRPAGAFEPTVRQRMRDLLRRALPALDREQRIALHERLESGGTLTVDFAVMTGLSSGIASLGMLRDSVAVVIGAMLVAPLMTPLLAVGKALVEANARMFRQATKALGAGFLFALLVPVVIGLIVPGNDLTDEVLARGTPNLLDLAIAGLSGLAGAYALARPGLAGTLVGVAIAVALVPPLAAAGILIANLDLEMASGALLLFVTNLVAIALGAALAYRLMGLRVDALDGGLPPWARTAILLLGVAALALSAPLGFRLVEDATRGREAVTAPVPGKVRRAVAARLADEPGVTLLGIRRSGELSRYGVAVTLLVEQPLAATVVDDLTAIVEQAFGPDTRAHIYALQSAELVEQEIESLAPEPTQP